MLAALGHAEGFAPVQAALEAGLLLPELPEGAPPLDDFAAWLGSGPDGAVAAVVFAHPGVARRGTGENLGLPDLASEEHSAVSTPRTADGLEWPLRLAAVWQQVHADPVRLTQ